MKVSDLIPPHDGYIRPYQLTQADFPDATIDDVPPSCLHKIDDSYFDLHADVCLHNNWTRQLVAYGDLSPDDAAYLPSPLDDSGLPLDNPIISRRPPSSLDNPPSVPPRMLNPDKILSDAAPAVMTVFGNGVSVRPRMVSPAPVSADSRSSRGVIRGFSESSRRRMRNLLLRLKLDAYLTSGKAATSARAFFLTLTWGSDFPEDWEVYKTALDNFRRRLGDNFARRGIRWSGVWKLEFQERGAPHFHILIFLDSAVGTSWLRSFVADKWSALIGAQMGYSADYIELVKRVSLGKVRGSSPAVIPLYGSSGVGRLMSYLLKYLCKVVEPVDSDGVVSDTIQTGRAWGVWNKQNLPFDEGVSFVFRSYDSYRRFCAGVRAYGSFSSYLTSLSGAAPFLLLGHGTEILQQILSICSAASVPLALDQIPSPFA